VKNFAARIEFPMPARLAFFAAPRLPAIVERISSAAKEPKQP
jgi:hypothetical protein